MADKDTEHTLSIAEVSRAARVTARTMRYWVKQGLLQAPPFRGPSTKYSPAQLVRIRAIKALRDQGYGLADIRRQLAKATAADLVAISMPSHAPAPIVHPAADPSAPPPSPSIERPGPPEPTYPAERWERIVLVPGLEIHVSSAGGALLRRMAQEIYTWFGPEPRPV